MIQTLREGTVIHYRGFPAELMRDIEVESEIDLDIQRDNPAMLPKTDNATGVFEFPVSGDR